MKVLKFIGRLIWCVIAILAIALVTCAVLVMMFGYSGEKLPWRVEEAQSAVQSE